MLRRMKNFFLPLLFTAIALGLLFPGGQALKPALPVLLGTLLFFNFYTIDIQWAHFLRKELLIYLLIVLGILPALVVTTTSFLPPEFRLGVFLVAITPAAISGPLVVGIIGGSPELSIANTVLFALLSPLSYTFLTGLYFDAADLRVSSQQIIMKLMLLIGLPFGLSLACKKIRSLTSPLHRLAAYSRLFFVLIVFTAISASSQELRGIPLQELAGLILVMLGIAVILYASGFLLGKDAQTKRALAVSMGLKNASLCIWLALSNFSPLTAIPATVYIIIQHSMNSLLIFHFSRK